MIYFNNKIKEARIEKKLTQKEFADMLTKNGCKTSHATISNWELNISRPDIDTLALICKILGKDGNYFFDTIKPDSNKDDYTKETQKRYGERAIDILNDYAKLNDIGRQKANENIKDLTKISEYIKNK